MNERDVFLAALEITDPTQRAAWIAQACGSDATLREQVESLLQTHAQTSQFLETPAGPPDSALAQTLMTNGSEADDASESDRDSGEAEFRRYLQPATRAGWLGRLAHYEIEAILGRGAFGIVAKAFDEKLHRVVAIKLMNPELATTSPPRKRFLREARTAAAVPHENIVAIHAVEEEPIPYLVMEYVPGQTLQQRMDAQGPFEPREILRIGQQVAAGLAAAHHAHLIHRDIKPSNILLAEGPAERVKISDFGLARAVDDATMTSSGMIAGTPLYMAPEQARGEVLDHRADLFSLGSVLYQMASGRPPFRAANTVAVLKRVCEDTPRPLDDVLPGIPSWLEAIIFKLLEKERDQRYQTAQEVADLLARCSRELEHNGHVTSVKGTPPAAATRVMPAQAGSRAQPRRHLLLAWTAGAIAAIALISWLLFNYVKPRPTGESPGPDAVAADPQPPVPPANISVPEETVEPAGWYGWPADIPKPAVAPFDAAQAQQHQAEWAAYLKVPIEYTDELGLNYRLIPPGTFTMGLPSREYDRIAAAYDPVKQDYRILFLKTESPARSTTLTRPFYLATTEVNYGQFSYYVELSGAVTDAERDGFGMVTGPADKQTRSQEGYSWRRMKNARDRGAGFLSFKDCQALTRFLSDRFGLEYRLPSEAEWEYACRAGTTTLYFTGDTLTKEQAAIEMNIQPVATYPPNAFGLYDMHGSVQEYVEDDWEFPAGSELVNVDPRRPQKSVYHIIRGGTESDPAISNRSSVRQPMVADGRTRMNGLRLALTFESVQRKLAGTNPPAGTVKPDP